MIYKGRITILEEIVKIAREYASVNPSLVELFQELDRAKEEGKLRYQRALEVGGIKCATCGRKFLPRHDDPSVFCSIGCKYSYEPKD